MVTDPDLSYSSKYGRIFGAIFTLAATAVVITAAFSFFGGMIMVAIFGMLFSIFMSYFMSAFYDIYFSASRRVVREEYYA